MKKRLLKLATMALLFVAAMTTGQAQNVPITLNQGWNWISYPYSESMTIQEALSGFTPVNGDVISSQTNGSSTYNNGTWRGTLTTLVPGKGYMYKSADGTTRTFVFGGAAYDPSILPDEALPGDFTVDANGTKVRFSPGNLQCRFNPTKAVEAIVGTGTNTTEYMPYNTYYCYSICHMIYRAEELAKAGMGPGPISSIAFESYSTNHYRRDNIKIWMMATTYTQAVNLPNPISGMTQVYEGSVIQHDGWTPISLSTPFVWDGESNVLVTVAMNHGSWTSRTYWQCSGQSPYHSCLYGYSDNSAFDPTDTNGLTSSFDRPNIRFNSKGGVTWRFAEKQWDYIGEGNSNASSSYLGWIDLFGWGTSGYPHGGICWQPWSTSTTNSDYYAYNAFEYYYYNLNHGSGTADWGCNAISNGGNKPAQWRTLSNEEWGYVFNTRSTTSGKRYAKAQVNGVNGVILLPDNWNTSYYTLNSTNTSGAAYTTNTISASQWQTLEQHGAVFLPAAGRRTGTSVDNVGSQGCYQSTTYKDADQVWSMWFNNTSLYANNSSSHGNRYMGRSVRLVCQSNPHIRTIGVTNVTENRATVSWEVNYTGSATLRRGVCWSTSSFPTAYYSNNWDNCPTLYADGTGAGSFSTLISATIQPNTTYHVRAFVRIGDETYIYGNELVFTTPEDIDNGHSYVDLGLPSGLLWADCNVGASNYYGYGDYFAWGETTTKSDYSWSNYQHCNGSSYTMTKYCNNSSYGYNGYVDNMTTLLPEDDPATANWGGYWRTPTKEEWQELYANTTVTWTQQNGVNGRRFTAPNGHSIFLPAAGDYSGSSLYDAGSIGYYWSSSLSTNYPGSAWDFRFSSDNYNMYDFGRFYGRSVRAVRTPRRN